MIICRPYERERLKAGRKGCCAKLRTKQILRWLEIEIANHFERLGGALEADVSGMA